MLEIRRATLEDAQTAFDIRLLAIRSQCIGAYTSELNAADFYRRCGYVGDEQAIYHSPSGLQLACIPMRKHLRRLR